MQIESITTHVISEVDVSAAIDAQVERFQRYFAKHAAGRCVVLFDPSMRDARHDPASGATIKEHLGAEIVIPHPQFPRAHRPYLVSLNLTRHTDSELLRTSVRMALEDRDTAVIGRSQGHRIGGWLASCEPADITAQHLSRHVMQGEGRRLPFRFYDMRCMTWLWPVLHPAQQRTLLGPIASWHLLDAAHRWQLLTPPVGGEPEAELTLDTAQWVLLARIGGTSRAFARYQHESGNTPSADQLAVAWSAAGRGVQLKLNDAEDMAAFILNALQWHPQFDRHPEVNAALKQRPPGQSSQAALADFDDATLRRFVHELNQTTVQGEL